MPSRSSWVAFGQLACALALGLLAFLVTIPRQALTGGAAGFTTFEDQLTYLASYRYYVWDEWRWPLLRASRLGGDAGTILVFTDSIPFYALALKIARRLIHPDFNFVGYWLALCYALQGVSAVVAVRLWGITRWAPTMAAAVLALALPAWIHRVAHTGLSFHAVLLLALGAYGWAERSRRPWPPILLGVSCCWIAAGVNVYLLLMTTAVCAATILRAWLRGWPASRVAAAAGLVAGVTLLEMWVLGYFEPHGVAPGYGTYSMNVLSPVHPGRSTLLGDRFGGLSPDATGGQDEGYNYLGLGLLVLVPVACFVGAFRTRSIVRRHWPLLLLAGVLTVWSWSSQVYWGSTLVASLPVPPDAMAQFRCTGRLFWPVAYLILLSSVVVLGRRGRALAAVLLACAVLQIVDTVAARRSVRGAVAAVPEPSFERAAWLPALEAHASVVVSPDWDCAPAPEKRPVVELVALAGIPRTTIDTVYSARPTPVDCAREAADFAALRFEPDELVVALDSVGAEVVAKIRDRNCVRFAKGWACSALPNARRLLSAIGRPMEGRFDSEGFSDDFETGDTLGWTSSHSQDGGRR